MRSSLDFQAPSQLFVFIIWSMFWTCIGVGILMLLNSSSSSSFSSYLWKSLHQKNVLEPQILALKSHFFGSCVFVSGSHQFFFMRFITKSFKFPWRSSQLKITDHRRFKAFFFFFFFLFFRESVRSVLCLTQFRHFSAFFIPTRKFCARKIRSNSSTPIDRSWLPNFCNAKMLHRRAMGFCLQKTRKQKPWSSTWPRDVGRHVQETKIYLIRRSSAAWFFASVTNLPST